jgi:hypothetical protein
MTSLQAIVISKDTYTKARANKWIKSHGFKPIKKMHETLKTYRYRLIEPDYYNYEYRTKKLTEGIKAIIQIPK